MIPKLLIAALGTLLLVPAASANPNAGIRMSVKGTAGLRLAIYTVRLSAKLNQTAPGAQVVFSNCGHLPLKLAPVTLKLNGKDASLYVNKKRQLQWNVAKLPPNGRPATIKLIYFMPRHKLPFSVCLRASAKQFVTSLKLNEPVKIKLVPNQ